MPHRDPQLPQHVRLSLVPQIALCVTLLACADPRYAEDQGADAGSGDSGAVDLGQDAMMPVDVGTDDGNIGDDAAIDAGEDASVDAGYDAGCSTLCYVDNDDDGYAASGASTVVACTCGTGLAAAAPTTHPTTDCNDNLAAVGPATATDPLRCGTCANVCATTTNGAPACVGGSCSISCDNGYALVTGACVAIMPPRQIAPMSTATTTL